MKSIEVIHSIAQVLEYIGMGKPKKPNVFLLNHSDLKRLQHIENNRYNTDLYIIAMNLGKINSMKYGRNYYDLDAGAMVFMGAGQTFTLEDFNINDTLEGWSLQFHPDLIRNYSLNEKLKKYSFFSYSSYEALHVGEEEVETITRIVREIEK